MPRRLRLPIADPCHEDWDAMQGEGARRFCDVCQTNVTNLSEMSEAQAGRFLGRKAGTNVCVRYRSDAAGNVRFKLPSVAAPAPTAMRGWRASLAAAGFATLLLGGCTNQRSPDLVDSDGCTYDLGPLEFRLKRGEGNCPPEVDEMMVMGAIPVPQEPMEMGKVAIEDPPEPEVEIEMMGDVAAPEEPLPEVQGQAAIGANEVPCVGKKP
jgi:hypothetical protein